MQSSSCDPFKLTARSKHNLMGSCSVQDLDDSVGLAENGMGIEAGSVLFNNVLKGPEQIAAPTAPAGPTGTGTRPASCSTRLCLHT